MADVATTLSYGADTRYEGVGGEENVRWLAANLSQPLADLKGSVELLPPDHASIGLQS